MDKETFRKKINYIIKKRGYESGSAFISKYKEGRNISTSTIQSWIYRGVTPESEDRRKDLIAFLECDYEYLFGTQEDPCKEDMTASKTTGLKYDTIEAISSMPSGYKTVIDALIEENCIESLFNVMSEWVSDSYTEVKIGKPGNVRLLSSEEAKKLFSYKIDTEMRSIVNYLLHNKDMMNTLIRTYQYNNTLQLLNNYKELLSDPKQSGQQKEIKKHIKAIEEELHDIMKKDYYTEWNK